MPLVAAKANASAFGLGWSASSAEQLGGMVLMTPTSIASTGTGNSSSIGVNGSVTFSSCASLSLNGVFTSDYDNYIIAFRNLSTANGYIIRARLRVGGTDNTTASSYVHQYVNADATATNANRTTGDSWGFVGSDDGQRSGATAYIYGPYLTQPTAFRTASVSAYLDAWLIDYAGTHNQSTAYDGITIYQGLGTFGGLVSVYGLGG